MKKDTLFAPRMEEIILDSDRTCKICVKKELCRYCDRMDKLIKELPLQVQPDGDKIFYITLANNCPYFQKRKINVKAAD